MHLQNAIGGFFRPPSRRPGCGSLPGLLGLQVAFMLGGALAADASPLVQAHAHNDYQHPRPLLDALDHGFCSIEADIHLVDGRLLVAHDLEDVKPERALAALYLDPLLARVRENGGRVYRDGPPVTLLVDVKSEAAATYAALHDFPRPFRLDSRSHQPRRGHRSRASE